MTQTGTHAPHGNAKEQSCILRDDLQPYVLADAFMGWECYEDAPLARSPYVLRFERCDLLAKADGGRLSFEFGAVDTAREEALAPIDESTCPIWVNDAALSDAIGQQATGFEQDGNGTFIVKFEHCIVRLRAEDDRVTGSLQPNLC